MTSKHIIRFSARSEAGLGLFELLCACTLLALLSLIVISSVQNTLNAGKFEELRLQTKILNESWQKLVGAGGGVGTTSAKEAVDLMVNGIEFGGVNFRTLAGAPEFEATIGNQIFSLEFSPVGGFRYIEANDATNRSQIMSRVPELAHLIGEMRAFYWDSSEFQSGLSQINALFEGEELQQFEQQLAAIGVVVVNGDAALVQSSREDLANMAAELLSGGVQWGDLSIELQSALTEYGENEREATNEITQ